jgi:quercetin dioxygenase-like cupin family protein
MSELSAIELERFARRHAGEPHRWRRHVRHETDIRVHELIWSDERVNAWVICWSEEQDTGFHDHDRSAGAIAVISGRVREERLALGGGSRVRELAAGASFHVPASAIHRVRHAPGAAAVTIHAYSPPLERMGEYRVGPDGELERTARLCDYELRAEPALLG